MNGVFARWVSLLWGLVLLTSSCLSQATNYQDWWSNPQLSGMGLNIGQQGKNIFVTWFMYDEKGDPSFLLFFGDLNDSQSLTAELRRYYGTEPSGYDESLWYSEVVGTATISFSGVAAGTFSYQYGSMSGSFPIQRYTFRNINLSGTYDGLTVGITSNCGADNGSWVRHEVDAITHNGNDFALTLTDQDGRVYNVQVDLTQHGTHFTGSGTFSGPDDAGTLSITDMQLVDDALMFKYVVMSQNGCRSDDTTLASRTTHAFDFDPAAFITEHNKWRAYVGVTEELRYSPALANQAQAWADHLKKTNHCKMRHSEPDGSYGENLYWASAIQWSDGRKELQRVTPKQVVDSWTNEMADYDYQTNTCAPGKVCDHYTQVVWRTTTTVGCAMAVCEDTQEQVWVCQYQPAGNWVGEKPY